MSIIRSSYSANVKSISIFLSFYAFDYETWRGDWIDRGIILNEFFNSLYSILHLEFWIVVEIFVIYIFGIHKKSLLIFLIKYTFDISIWEWEKASNNEEESYKFFSRI